MGTLVQVEARTWPGINKHGGVAKVTKLFLDDKTLISVDVKYVLGGTEKQVDMEYVTCHDFASHGREEDVSRGAGRASRRKRKPTIAVVEKLEKPKTKKKAVRTSKRILETQSKSAELHSDSATPSQSGGTSEYTEKSLQQKLTVKPKKKSVEKKMQGLTLKPKTSQVALIPQTNQKPQAPVKQNTKSLTTQTFTQISHASKVKTKPTHTFTTHVVQTKASAVTPGSSGKKSHFTNTSTKLHTDIDVADLLATTGGAAVPKQLQRHTPSISKVSASATNSKYSSATTSLSSSSAGKKEQGSSSLATVFHNMTGEASAYVQNMVGKTINPVAHVVEKSSKEAVVDSPSCSSSCDSLSFRFEKS